MMRIKPIIKQGVEIFNCRILDIAPAIVRTVPVVAKPIYVLTD
jgi:hypothetical protein